VAGAFSAKVDISTKEAVAGLRAARTEARLFGQGLNELDKIIRANKQNLVLAAQQFTKLVAAQRAAAAGAKDMAQADIAAARAAGIRNVAEAKKAELLARKANQEAQAARATAQTGVASARVADIEARREAATDRVARANQRAARSQLELHDSLSNTRYLMYDVGATYGVISAGLMAIPAATAAVAMAYQKDFANVERVTNDLEGKAALPELRQSLKDIATEIPVAFGDLSRITQLGAQMGVANEKLSEFTETTAKFVAVTGISADEGSQLFGRMETSFTEDVAKFPDFFDRLGASIAHVGAETVATDPQIAALLNQIGPLGAEAGFSADQIVGLSAALASVRVQPELARGTLTRVFGQLNRDVAEGSPRLAEFGKLMGVSGEQAGKLWQTDPSKFFTSLIKGLNETHTNGGSLTTTLDKLGIKASRDVSAITKLAVGYDTLQLSMDAANKGFSEGTALNDMFKPIADTAIAKLQMMANAWSNLADTLGASSLGPLAGLIDIATNLAVGLDNLIDDVPMVGTLITALMGMAAVTAVFLGFKAAQAFVIAGFVGFQQASTRGIGSAMSMSGVLKQAAQTMLITKGATDAQSRALIGQAGAWKALQVAMSTSADRLAATATVSNNLDASTRRTTSGVRAFGSSLLGMVGGPIGIAIMALAGLAGQFINAGIEADQAGKAIADGLSQGADAGMRAISDQLKERKVGMLDRLGIPNWGKDVTKIATEVGVGFDQIVGSIAKGKDGVAEFDRVLDAVAKKKGFADFNAYFAGHSEGAEKLNFLKNIVGDYIRESGDSATATKTADDALAKLGVTAEVAGDGIEEGTSDIDKMTDALKALNDEVFGIINAEAALQGALQKIGEGLHESGSFSVNNEGGRENLQNFQDAMEASRDYFFKLMQDGTLTAEQAAQGYADFIQGLINEIRAQGGDTSGVEALAQATAQKFGAAIGANPATILVDADTMPAEGEVQTVAGEISSIKATMIVGMDPSNADANIMLLAQNIAKITGLPYNVVMDAMTNPAHEKAAYVEEVLTAITNGTYTAAVDADTSAAITNVQNFVAFARTELAHLQAQMNNGVGLADGEGSMSPAQKAQYAAIGAPKAVAVPKQVRAPLPMPKTNLGQNLQGIADGYAKAGKEAEKAGKKAKKAAEDMADGITDAVRQAEDYASRLKTGLMSAFNQQYALATATDAYHSALNGINKKREEEIKQVTELRDKVRELNDERNKELISANKAKIEQNISIKYGEMDRAADYGQQATEALNNAAAKQKEIEASKKQANEIEAGIGLLTGYSDAAIANRAALRDLESKTLDMIAAYASQGHSIEEVRAYAQQLTGQFQTDVGQLGFNQIAVQALQGDLGRYIDVVNRVPLVKPTTIEADTDQATADVTAFNDLLDGIPPVVPVEVKVTTSSFKGIGEAWSEIEMPDGSMERVNRGQSGDLQDGYYWQGGQVRGYASGGMVPGQSPADPRADNMMAKVDGKGLIGIRSREFIQPEPAVDYYGLDFMEAIRTMKLPKYYMGGSPSGGSGSSGAAGSAVELGASTLKTLTDAMRTEVALQIDAREIARASNRGNRQLSAEGQN
jgi:TP901 family phage tail tape measure protein